ncbi:HNH endonuclease [Streptomyces sp. NPDC004752]
MHDSSSSRARASRCSSRPITDGIAPSRPDTSEPARWTKVMAKRRRKTLVVCANCHGLIHQQGSPATFTT